MELRCLVYMTACMASFPLYRRPETGRSVVCLTTMSCIITSIAAVGIVATSIWNVTLPQPFDDPGVRVLRINGCLTGIIEAGSLLFLCVFGIRKDGLHRYLITLKKIRNVNKPRPSKEPRLIFKLLDIIAAVYIVTMGFCVLFLFTGLIPNDFSHFYRSVFAPSFQTYAMFQVYAFSASPFLVAIGAGSGVVHFIFLAIAIMA